MWWDTQCFASHCSLGKPGCFLVETVFFLVQIGYAGVHSGKVSGGGGLQMGFFWYKRCVLGDIFGGGRGWYLAGDFLVKKVV